MNVEDANNFVRKAVALGYYTQSGVSIGYCAQTAGMSEEDFVNCLGQNHISIFHLLYLAIYRQKVQYTVYQR
ncbi:MAG: UPF0175 family protein [Lachnospiraceae bacterium]|nr:UPF0175 family protein [Lachnospiraceae bacterium]